ncbi:HtaA domain-containing protein, partial [Streptomyces clavuligerus]
AGAAIGLRDGVLEWGFKESFRTYVARSGTITARDGATQAARNGTFTFTGGTGTYTLADHSTRTAFTGEVEFRTPRLSLVLADVRVSTAGTRGTVEADVTVDGEKRNDIPVAEVDLTGASRPTGGEGGAMVFTALPAKLTAEGAAAFRYPAGEAVDPL